MSGENRAQDMNNAERVGCPRKCKIPQRLPTGRVRPFSKSKSQNSEIRPKSASRATDNQEGLVQINHLQLRSIRQDREFQPPTFKKPVQSSTARSFSAKLPYHGNTLNNQKVKPDITVPKQQVTNKQREQYLIPGDYSDADTAASKADKILGLKIDWQEQMTQFQQMKNDLKNRQTTIMQLHNSIRNTQEKLKELGHIKNLVRLDDLRIINLEDMSPDQILQLCSNTNTLSLQEDDYQLSKKLLNFDASKFKEIPMKLVTTCEQTLFKMKEFIDWFDNLKNQERECPKSKLTKKINEFKAENDILNYTLQSVSKEFLTDLEEVTDLVRNCMKQAVAVTITNEDLTSEISTLNSQNAALRKQLHNVEKFRPHQNKLKLEELERELKEVKSKKLAMKDRLSRAEGQFKISEEKASRLEASLEQARIQIRGLERTVQDLNDENYRLQRDFDEELTKLKESISSNTSHLEEIGSAREKLQAEKFELEKRLEELSSHYNESILVMKQELNLNVTKINECEKKYHEVVEEKNNLQMTIEAQCAKLVEVESCYSDKCQMLQDTELRLNTIINEKDAMKRNKDAELEYVTAKLQNYEKLIEDQNHQIEIIKEKLNESQKDEEQLKVQIKSKIKHIEDLENNQINLEKQIQESVAKAQSYEEQLSAIKHQIENLQEHFGEFESFDELHNVINDKNYKLVEIAQKNEDLNKLLETKLSEMETYKQTIVEQESLITQRNDIIHLLSEKDKEQTNIIKLLRNNLDIQAQADDEVSRQLNEKDIEVKSLLTNLEKRKQQICQLEKIILALDEHKCKASIQRNKDQERIKVLENKITEYEQRMRTMKNDTYDHLDKLKLIDILEAEVEATANPPHLDKSLNKKLMRDINRDYYQDLEQKKIKKNSLPTKIVLGNFVEKTYISNNKKENDFPNRKTALMNINASTRIPSQSDIYRSEEMLTRNHDLTLLQNIEPEKPLNDIRFRNITYLGNKAYYDKKCKMFEIASHRLA